VPPPTRKQARKSPAHESAAQHLAAFVAFAVRLQEIERRELVHVQQPGDAQPWPHPDRWVPGHAILTLLAEAGASDQARRKLVRALGTIEDRMRAYRVAIGDDLRARGLAVPLCWLPGDSTEEEER
jgi:hypothetical protein